MSQLSANKPLVVGVVPWLPWPFGAWSWWTRPVSAERLAILRIGLAIVLLADLWFQYRPYVLDFFAQGSLGSPELFQWYWQSHRLNWSVLRGFGDPLTSAIAMLVWIGTFVWLAIDGIGRLTAEEAALPRRSTWGAFLLWNVAGVVWVLGVWARSIPDEGKSNASWALPLAMFAVTLFLATLEFARLALYGSRVAGLTRLFWILGSFVLVTALVLGGRFLPFAEWVDEKPMPLADRLLLGWGEDWQQESNFSLIHRLLLPWQNDPVLLQIAFWTWFTATVGLLFGIGTRAMAVAAWIFSVSFAHANSYIDNAGDVVRGIILFYLMLCPCGAAWSFDACLRRWRTGDDRRPFVSPWALRLLFLQMCFIYFMNGIYKIFGDTTWKTGDSMFLVLGDVTLTRFAHDFWPMPYAVTMLMTWTVLAWELSFPLLVLFPYARGLALVMGAMFHLGIFVTMELGGFAPYMLTLYLPLLPLSRWRKLETDEPAPIVAQYAEMA